MSVTADHIPAEGFELRADVSDGHDFFQGTIQLDTIVVQNRDEAIGFTQTQNIETACDLLKIYCKQFAITCGAEGALVFDGEQLISVAAPAVKAIDTNGAGDMFAGAFLHAINNGKDFKTAAEFANRAAAKVVSQFGPRLQAEQHAELKEGFFN